MVTVVRVANLALSARIGINPDERGRRQPLVVTVDLTMIGGVGGDGIATLADSVDYRRIVAEADAIAECHIGLIETFAHRLATRCLALGAVACADVHVAKPEALSRGLASVRVTLSAAGQPVPRAAARAAR